MRKRDFTYRALNDILLAMASRSWDSWQPCVFFANPIREEICSLPFGGLNTNGMALARTRPCLRGILVIHVSKERSLVR